ncbi:HigA family addiction module antitoxin [Flavihumibacter petaseus]|uniref:Putative toxin-antitoxin system antitoxin component n=1 Tax=Flavihumibacter petaseus NBRC 106054 TaxID=1220578 RepID=A0A0E9N6F9_9BACT|nr:HigA family addiction module antitoxin [Flavihumibacter petaseus]GAO45399.1 putative toxin-antitoxin system antitoxin component [Flavihumibacter petaseus NBRC 106054]
MAKQNQYIPSVVFHPGETLAEKLAEMEMGPKEFALRTGKPEKTIIAILSGKSAITPDMAVQFETVTKIPANFWMNHQRSYDEFIAREKHKTVIDDAIAWAKQFPLNDMIKKGWLPPVGSIREKTMAILTFFGFSNHTGWEEYYFNQTLKLNFRISLAETNEPYAISAWLRKGELQAAELKANDYSEKSFKEALPGLKSLMATHPDDFFIQLQSICLRAGVKVVHTPCINKAPISGSTRWLNDTPLIQLTGRYKRNDSFWFTFFHEAGHIILHGKKDVFLEKVDYSDKDNQKEAEADEFAVKWTLTEEEEAEIIDAAPLSEEDIRAFAKQFNTHPGIIIGRLQHKKIIPYSLGQEYLEPVIFE